jgi:hypothetical protein
MTAAGFPHSGTSGSTPTCGSPKLFAAYRALLRLSVPRHPPCALVPLDRMSYHPAHHNKPFYHTHAVLRAAFHLESARSRFSLRFLPPDPNCQSTSAWESAPGTSRSTCESFLRQCVRPRPFVLLPTRCSRKEVIQPQVPLRLPCYDFAPVTELAFGGSLPEGLGHRLRALPTSMA